VDGARLQPLFVVCLEVEVAAATSCGPRRISGFCAAGDALYVS